MMSKILSFGLFMSLVCFSASPVYAVDKAKVDQLYQEKIKAWVNDPIVINALKAQNEKHSALSQSDIDALDAKWKSDDVALIDPVLNNDLSKFLQTTVSGSEGLYTEIIVMDNKGLNVGQSSKTSDYWQGDEDKFLQTFPKGVDAINIGDVELDESTQTYQVQINVTVSDAGTPIGAVTIGLNAESVE